MIAVRGEQQLKPRQSTLSGLGASYGFDTCALSFEVSDALVSVRGGVDVEKESGYEQFSETFHSLSPLVFANHSACTWDMRAEPDAPSVVSTHVHTFDRSGV